mmetsp:Transcript_15493/g.34200  ORF Transcript_15493/g.34200 Transcript_15493/m.34200 type:complete len:216 (+) Transcript_15493:821-1468(+)
MLLRQTRSHGARSTSRRGHLHNPAHTAALRHIQGDHARQRPRHYVRAGIPASALPAEGDLLRHLCVLLRRRPDPRVHPDLHQHHPAGPEQLHEALQCGVGQRAARLLLRACHAQRHPVAQLPRLASQHIHEKHGHLHAGLEHPLLVSGHVRVLQVLQPLYRVLHRHRLSGPGVAGIQGGVGAPQGAGAPHQPHPVPRRGGLEDRQELHRPAGVAD